MLTLYTGKIPIEPRSLFDDDIMDLFYGFTKTSIKCMNCAVMWKDNMSHVEERKSCSDEDFNY